MGNGEPKYLNSPETALFHKGKELYGLYEYAASRAAERLLIVEGYMDTVRLHQAGSPTRSRRSAPRPPRTICAALFAWSASWCSASTAIAPGAPRPGGRCRTCCRRCARVARSASCSCPMARIPTHWWARKAARLSKRGCAMRAAVRIPDCAAQRGSRSGACRRQGALCRAGAPADRKDRTGVYRELLLERIAQAVGISSPRLSQWLSTSAGGAAPSAQGRAADAPGAPRGRGPPHGRRWNAPAAVAC